MAIILIASDDAGTISILAQTAESLGHTPLRLSGTENIVEDVVLNDVELVLLAPDLEPFSGWEACEMLRGDPSVPGNLPILLITKGRHVRRLEKCGFNGTLDPDDSAALLSEIYARFLGGHTGVPEPRLPADHRRD